MHREKIAVAMSGGVDSSVAAALLLEEGYGVIGLTMDLAGVHGRKCGEEGLRSCCGWRAVEDANRVAAGLGIPHYVLNLRREFEELVVRDFCREYALGRTPNPCLRCNERVKFDVLAGKARKLGASFLATGHHARLSRDAVSGRFLLRKGRDPQKDQSYFLYTLTQGQLAFIRFPVGELTKTEVRGLARRLGLATAEKPESQEICFIPDDDYSRYLRDRQPGAERPGPILDQGGRVIGRHEGIIHFTVGQRKGLGISSPRPLYVLDLDPVRNAVVAGPNEALYGSLLEASHVHWISAAGPSQPSALKVKIRSRHSEADAVVTALPRGRCRVEFLKPQRAITPGQSAVFYDGDAVVGGGIIDRTPPGRRS